MVLAPRSRFTLANFLSVVFDAGEATCFSADIKGTRVFSARCPPPGSLFFSINPLNATHDLHPTESYHFTTKPRRADLNCTRFRTILCEFDRISLDEQLSFIENCGIPYSALTYSGGKSIHALLVLEQDVERTLYDALVRRVFKALGNEVDSANKNPSRLSRLPGSLRENGNIQDLIEVKSRVSLQALETWLENRGITDLSPAPEQTAFEGIYHEPVASPKLSLNTLQFLEGNYLDGTWNISLFKAACELFKRGSNWNDVVSSFTKITGFLDAKDVSTLRSAQRTLQARRPYSERMRQQK